MASNAYYRALLRAHGANLRLTLGDRYAEKPQTKTATVLDNSTVRVGNQRYKAEGVQAATGAALVVRNIGTRANAIYAPDAAASVAFGATGGSGSGGSGGGAGTFLELSDTFASYSGLAGQYIKVDSGPSGLTAGAIADGDLPSTIVRTSRQILAGTGLTGGGNLSADRTLSVNVAALIDPLYALTAPAGKIRVNVVSSSGLQFIAEDFAERVTHTGDTRVTHTGDTRVSIYDDVASGRSLGIKLSTPSGLLLGTGGLAIADSIAGDGLAITSKVLSINLASPSGLQISADALAIADSIAGDGLDISGKVLSVDTGRGLEIFNAEVRVDEDTAFAWTAKHTWGSVASLDPAFGGMFLNAGNPDGSAALKVSSYDIADITLYLKQIAGQTASLWRVEDVDGDALILLSGEGNLESGQPGFVSGLTGWRISATGDAEFNNIVARGEFHASTFVMDEMLVSNGTQFVGTGGKLLNSATSTNTSSTHTRVTNSGDTRVTHTGDTRIVDAAIFAIDVEDPVSGHAKLFRQNDVARIKNWDGDNDLYDNWVEVNSAQDMTNYWRYWVTLKSGTPTTLPAGAAMVSYGQVGDGNIILTSDLSNAPYIDIFTRGDAPWSGGIKPHVRLGQLSGVGLAGSSQFGMIAGRDLSSTNLSNPYFLLSDVGARLHNIRLTLYDGARTWVDADPDALTFTMGTDTGSPGGRLLRLDAAAQTMQIGNPTNPAAVTLYGQIVIDDSGANNAATKASVTSAQSAAQAYADSAAAGAVTTAQAYADIIASSEADAAQAAAQAYAAAIASSEADAAQAAAQAYADTLTSTAQTNAQAYANARRVLAVDVSWAITGTNIVSWSIGTLRMGDGSTVTISIAGNTGAMSGRVYVYWRPTESTFRVTASASNMAAGDVLIAVAEPGADKAAVTVVGGRTYISGDWINTGSITANQIKAGTITAGQIATGAITAGQIAAGAITALQIATDAITADKISAGAVTADKISTGAVTAGKIAAGSVTADRLNVTTLSAIAANLGNVTAGSIVVTTGANKLWLNDSGDGDLAIGGNSKTSAPFRVTASGAMIASSANITGAINASSLNINGGSNVYSSVGIGLGGKIFSGTSDFASGTGWYLDYNVGAPRFLVGTKSGGALIKGIQWDGSDIAIRVQDTNAVNKMGVNTGDDGLITINMRQSSGVGGYDYGIFINDGGNTSSGVSALYHGESNQASAIDRIFNAATWGSAKSDGFYGAMSSGTWAGGNSTGVAFKGSHGAGGVVALFNQTGAGLNAPVVYATGLQQNVGIYQATIGAAGQTAFRVDNSIGANITALQAAGGGIDDVGPLRLRSQGGHYGSPGGGYIYLYQIGNGLYIRTTGNLFQVNTTMIS